MHLGPNHLLLVAALSHGVLSTPIVNNAIGNVQVLWQNDLAQKTNSTSALFLHEKHSYSQTVAACKALSESLLQTVPADIKDQLNYLVYSNSISSDARIYIAKSYNNRCNAWDQHQKKVVSVDCATKLPALCTQSAPPYSASQQFSSINKKTEVTVNTELYSITGYEHAIVSKI